MTELRATLRHRAHKRAYLSPNGGNFSRLYNNKVSRAPKSACIKHTEAWRVTSPLHRIQMSSTTVRVVAA